MWWSDDLMKFSPVNPFAFFRWKRRWIKKWCGTIIRCTLSLSQEICCYFCVWCVTEQWLSQTGLSNDEEKFICRCIKKQHTQYWLVWHESQHKKATDTSRNHFSFLTLIQLTQKTGLKMKQREVVGEPRKGGGEGGLDKKRERESVSRNSNRTYIYAMAQHKQAL